MPDNDLAKLPRWAQFRIVNAQATIDKLTADLATARGESAEPTHVRIDDYTTRTTPLPNDTRFIFDVSQGYGRTRQVEVKMGEDSNRDGAMRRRYRVVNIRAVDGGLVVRSRSTNQITVEVEDY